MKFIKIVAIAFLIGTQVFFASCGEDSEPMLAIDIIQSGTWYVSSVERDGTLVSSEFGGFTIAFDPNGSYRTTNTTKFGSSGTPLAVLAVWEPSGTYYSSDRSSETRVELVLDDGRIAYINIESETSIAIEIDCYVTNIGRGRSKGLVSFAYLFALTK